MIREIILPDVPPSKKNNRNLFNRGGRLFNIPSQKYLDWNRLMSLLICHEEPIREKIEKLFITFYLPDNRNRDLTNMAEGVMDLLVENKIIEDDNWKIIPALTIISAGVFKDNPRTQITIHLKNDIDFPTSQR